MTALRKLLGTVLLAVLVFGTPMMACLSPDAQLTPEERKCCQQMGSMCGRSGMPSSHSCCKTVVRPIDDANATKAISTVPFIAIEAFPTAITAELPRLLSPDPQSFESPPESPPAQITILRI